MVSAVLLLVTVYSHTRILGSLDHVAGQVSMELLAATTSKQCLWKYIKGVTTCGDKQATSLLLCLAVVLPSG